MKFDVKQLMLVESISLYFLNAKTAVYIHVNGNTHTSKTAKKSSTGDITHHHIA